MTKSADVRGTLQILNVAEALTLHLFPSRLCLQHTSPSLPPSSSPSFPPTS